MRRILAGVLVVGLVTACSSGGSSRTTVSRIRARPLAPGFVALTRPVLKELDWVVVQGDTTTLLYTGSHIRGTHGSNPAYAYDIADHTMVRVADAPFSPAAEGLQGVAAGHTVVVLGIACRDVGDRRADPPIQDCRPGTPVAARFDLRTRRWTRIADPPAYGIAFGGVGTGTVFQLNGSSRLVGYDTARDRWGDIPPPDVSWGTGCVTGTGDIVMESPDPAPANPLGFLAQRNFTLHRLEPGSSTWRTVPLPPPPFRFFDMVAERHANDLSIVCGAHGFLLTELDLTRTWWYDLAARRWTDTHAPVTPTNPATFYGSRLVIGDHFYFWGAEPALGYDASGGTWSSFATGGPERLDPTVGNDTVVAGAYYATQARRVGRIELVRWIPEPLPLSPG